MQFCDDCGSMMRAEDGEMVCTECDASVEKDPDLAATYTTTEAQTDDDVIETDEETTFEGKPRTQDVTCDSCGNGEAWYAFLQTASADEPPTRFLKCTDCGHRWREYN